VSSKSFLEKNEHSDILFLLACWIQHYVCCNLCKYIKKIYWK